MLYSPKRPFFAIKGKKCLMRRMDSKEWITRIHLLKNLT